ncbi:MAG: hypothetical protein HC820_02485 [Hydrococcus sp. RM1_1_31]|nr:hypothetical protein [Hydrococcus sp. RM1_1_31]
MLAAERIESIKAGILAAMSFGAVYGVVLLSNRLLLAVQVSIGIDLFIKVAIALLSGFLFGVTYRYIVRSDRNSHLKDGAVLAFGLVRGLATIEVSGNLQQNIWLLSLISFESLFCFAIARFTLDFALERVWIKPYQ